MLKIGLTGGIGSGKTSVCKLFAAFGIGIVDADLIARQLVEPGQPALAELANIFGACLLQEDGSLNRAALRDQVFSDPEKKHRLESFLHPLIYAKIDHEIAALSGHYCIVAVPLLLETGKTDLVDRILVVDCSVEQQLQRVLLRDHLTQEQALAIIANQWPREQRLAWADDIIDNSSSQAQLAEQVKNLHNSYTLLATARTSSA